jgi:hypothetical protein
MQKFTEVPMRAVSVAMIALLLAPACAPAPKAGVVPHADDQRAGDARASAESAQPAAMGKRAPPQPGEQVSPVIAFRGHAEHWSIRIENAGGHAHDVDFTWGMGSQHATGRLQYQGQPGAVAGTPILLAGTLGGEAGGRAMRVEIRAAACTDDADEVFSHAVRVTVEGMAPMSGCGELAK